MNKIQNGDTVWFTADLHFGHTKMLEYSHRPFKTVEECDTAIIKNINDRVMPKHTLYILGDFAITHDRQHMIDVFQMYRNRINCKKIILVMGNHDPHYKNYEPKQELRKIFDGVLQNTVVKHDGCYIFLSHYAHRVWPQSHYGSWHLYGHSHGQLIGFDGHGLPKKQCKPDGTLPESLWDTYSLSLDDGLDFHDF